MDYQRDASFSSTYFVGDARVDAVGFLFKTVASKLSTKAPVLVELLPD